MPFRRGLRSGGDCFRCDGRYSESEPWADWALVQPENYAANILPNNVCLPAQLLVLVSFNAASCYAAHPPKKDCIMRATPTPEEA
jgi:hypothetical protein